MERLRKAEEGMAAFRLDNIRLKVQINELKKKLNKVCATPTPRYGPESELGDSRGIPDYYSTEGVLYGTKWDDLC